MSARCRPDHRRRASVACLALALLGTPGCTDRTTLQAGLGDHDANEIVALLRRSGIQTAKQPGKAGVTLVVADSELARATELMHAAGLPRKAHDQLGQVFKKDGMISTPMEERARYLHALSQELEATISQIDNVVVARVHIVLPERVAPGEPVQPSSASVFVKYQPPFDEDLLVPRIRRLVGGSIPGLGGEEEQRKLSVVLVPAEPLAVAVEWDKVGPFMLESESARRLHTWLWVATTSALAALGAGFGLWIWRRRRTQRDAQPAAGGGGDVAAEAT